MFFAGCKFVKKGPGPFLKKCGSNGRQPVCICNCSLGSVEEVISSVLVQFCGNLVQGVIECGWVSIAWFEVEFWLLDDVEWSRRWMVSMFVARGISIEETGSRDTWSWRRKGPQ